MKIYVVLAFVDGAVAEVRVPAVNEADAYLAALASDIRDYIAAADHIQIRADSPGTGAAP
ncbi:MAG: hypothetical protein AB7P35_17905 [Hyphomonadaceae bacterium]